MTFEANCLPLQAGSIVGLILNGWITERIGYRWTMQIAMVMMIGAIFIPFFSTGLSMFLAGQICQSIPWGVFQTLAVTYAADICPLTLRHYMTSWVSEDKASATRRDMLIAPPRSTSAGSLASSSPSASSMASSPGQMNGHTAFRSRCNG